MSEPIKHHYIPQFILRNFSKDHDGYVYYYDKKLDSTSLKRTDEIFFINNLYRDEVNNPDNPTQLEKDFSVYEGEVSQIINKMNVDNEIILSREEDDKLKLFLALIGMRSYITSKTFGKNAKKETKEFYSLWQEDGNLTDFWKRNLGEAVKYRSIKEVVNSNNIDEPFKLFLARDGYGLLGFYFILVERRGSVDFIIGDAYPVVTNSINDEMHIQFASLMYFPISSSRMLIMAEDGIEYSSQSIKHFNQDVLRKPQILRDGKYEKIKVKKIYSDDVILVNSIIKEYSKIGYAFADESRLNIEKD